MDMGNLNNILLEILATGVRFYAIKCFIDIFLSKDEYQCKYTWVLYVIACLWTSIIYEIFKMPVLNIISNLTAIFLLVCPYKVKMSRKLLITVMIYAVNVLVDSIVVLSFTKYTVGDSVNQIYECITSLVILIIAIALERTIPIEKDIYLPVVYRISLGAVPVISIGCLYYMVITGTKLKMTVVVVAACILFINILIFYLYNSLIQFYSAHIEKKMLEQMVEVYSYQLDVARESQKQVNSLRHDMKHHIIELQSMLKNTNNPEIIKYLQDMEKFMLNPKEYVSTGNKEIDGVLNYLLRNAEQVLKDVDIKIRVPEKIYWNDFNICAILGNLVDNAVREASKSEEKYLKIDIQTKKGIMLIHVKNSYSGRIIETGNKIQTSQKEVAIHGIGLENVKKIVKSNDGEIEIGYTENYFEVKILLYLSDIK